MTAAWTTRRFAAAAACLGAAALAVRLIYLSELRSSPLFSVPVGDGWQYDLWAQRMAGGDWLGSEAFYQSPLYPYFLACIYSTLGHDLLAVRIIQAVIGSLACVFLAIAGRSFFGARAGVAAGALLAVYPFAIFSDGLIQKSSLDVFLIALLLACLGIVKGPLEGPPEGGPHRQYNYRQYQHLQILGAGVALALLTLNRETTRLLYPVIVLWFLLRDRPIRARVSDVGLFTLAMALVIVPVGIRNYAVSGEFLISTWQLGPNFYIGNNPGARGYCTSRWRPAEAAPSGNAKTQHASQSRRQAAGCRVRRSRGYWLGRSVDFIRREPVEWIRQLGVKTVLTFNRREISDSESLETYAEFSAVLRALEWFTFAVVMSLAAAGAWLTRDRWKSLWPLYALFAALAVSVIIFYVFARYRYPLVPIAMLFSGAAIAQIHGLVRRPVRTWSTAVLVAAAVAIVCHVPVAADLADTTFFNVGVGLVKSGRPAEAVRLLEKAVGRAPDDAAAHYELGGALSAIGDNSRAARAFEATVRLRPDDWEARTALGVALTALGRTQDALAHFTHAARLKPDAPAARKNLGMAFYELGEDEKAIVELSEAVRLRADDVVAHYTLAQLHARAGRGAETLRSLEAALAAAKKAGMRDEVTRIEEAIRLARAQMAPGGGRP